MRPRRIIDRSTTPDGALVELALEGDDYVLRVSNQVLMASSAFGSEQEMAGAALEALGGRRRARVLVGGLGLGYTLRAVLDAFGRDAEVVVAELLPELVTYNRGVLGPLAGHPLSDRRVTLFEGDVRVPLGEGGWDAVLLDVDNGPDAMTTRGNATLYGDAGGRRLAASVTPGGVAVVWSAQPSRGFERSLRRAGLTCEVRKVSRRTGGRGGSHFLFVARAPRGARRLSGR